MSDTATTGDMRVWYIPQIPGEPYIVNVPDLPTAKLVLDALTGLSAYEYEHRIKPDYSDVGGVSRYEPAGAYEYEWHDYDLGDDDDLEELQLPPSR